METQEIEQEETVHQPIGLTHKAQLALVSTGKWSMFLAILGFIGVGLMVIGGLIFAVTMSALPASAMKDSPFMPGLFGGLFGFVYVITAAIYLFPLIKLYKFAKQVPVAVKEASENLVEEALINLNKHYKIIGY